MRIKGLDFLRGIAIAGVLCRHSHMQNFLVSPGGYGVDLFFVLSGFLVSGLLFSEYKKTGNAETGRFLIRRGFKIYPAFYFYLGILILTEVFFFKRTIGSSSILTEVFFLQSYGNPIQFHTWSLAIEEHFYILLSLLIFLAIRFGWMPNRKAIISFLIAAIVLIFTLRFIHCLPIGKPRAAFFATHLRADGLFMGALFSYLWHFSPDFIKKILAHRRLLYFIAAILVAPCFLIAPGSFFMMTIGLNILHLGFAVFILLLADEYYESMIFRTPYLKTVAAVVCFLGINSYSIYLWHLLVEDVIDSYIPESEVLNIIIFFAGAIAIGLLSSYFIERKFLNIREKYFPRRVQNPI